MKSPGVFLLLLFTASLAPGEIVSPNTNLTAREEQIIAAARPEPTPRFNGAQIIGIRPRTPLLHSLAATGSRPMSFSAEKLPAGLKLDSATGIISGQLARPGEYTIRVRARNSLGQARSDLRVVCGDTLALLPPMGWNSYDAFGDSVTEAEVLANAAWLKEHLQPLGWDTVVVDFRW